MENLNINDFGRVELVIKTSHHRAIKQQKSLCLLGTRQFLLRIRDSITDIFIAKKVLNGR